MIIMVLVTLLHSLRPHTGVRVINAFGIAKIVVLLGIVGSGVFVLAGGLPTSRIPDPFANFRHPFSGSATEPYGYAIATLKIVRRRGSLALICQANTFVGWSSPAYVLGEIKRPIETINRAGPAAILFIGLLCAKFRVDLTDVSDLLANIAYLSVATVEEIENAGVTVASLFFRRVYGSGTERVLSAVLAGAAISNVMTVIET